LKTIIIQNLNIKKMAKIKKVVPKKPEGTKNEAAHVSSSFDDLLIAAAASGSSNLETGRFIVTLKEAAGEKGLESLSAQGMRMADARDFKTSAVEMETLGDADGLYFNEIGCAVISGAAAKERSMGVQMELSSDSAIATIEPEYFAFASGDSAEFLRGFLRATEVISKEIGNFGNEEETDEADALVLGNTWGLVACRVPTSPRSGAGIKVAVLDTGMFLTHPDFAGRPVVSQSFIGGQPVMDGNGHGTHCIGTSCGPKTPPGNIQRYGIGWRANIFAGKVLSNSGSGSTATVLAGMNWAIANRCQVISMSLGSQSPIQAAYTAAGQAALNNGCLIIAAAGNAASATGAPANSPTIMSVAALDQALRPANFSNFGKVEIAGPGVGVFSSWPLPQRYNTISGTSMATPHVAGCAALWAETSPNLRGMNLWRKLTASVRRLPFPLSKVGAGLVQAPQI
jgi:subtilisin family serine protease